MPNKILIIDDDADTREMYAEVFKEDGFEVFAARDGLEGLELANKEKPDIIFTGIIMPRLDGFGMVENLRKNVATANIPVMISSHLGRKEDQLKAREMGIEDFIILGFVPPNKVVSLARARVEGLKGSKYRLGVEASSRDAARMIEDLKLSPGLKCPEHDDEQMVLELKPSKEKPGSFEAMFVCPENDAEKRGTSAE